MALVKAFPYKRLQREARLVLHAAGTEIVIFELRGSLYALENACPHQGMPLEDGLLDAEQGTLTCLYHQWCFGLADGCGRDNASRVRTWPVHVDDGYVWVEIEEVGGG